MNSGTDLISREKQSEHGEKTDVIMVKHIMIEDVVTAKPSVTVKDAIKILDEKHVGSIIITDESQKCLGIFTERDAIRIVASDVLLDTAIDQVMTKHVATIGEEASLNEAKRLLISHGIRHLPVLNSKEEVVGLLSVRGFLDELFGLSK